MHEVPLQTQFPQFPQFPACLANGTRMMHQEGDMLAIKSWRRRHAEDSSFFAAGNVARVGGDIKVFMVEEGEEEEEDGGTGMSDVSGMDTDTATADMNAYDAGPASTFPCKWPQCGSRFSTLQAFDAHCQRMHQYTCSMCRRSLPTSHLLDIHLTEMHDAYFAAKVARADKQRHANAAAATTTSVYVSPLFVCLVEDCCHKCHSAAEREQHLQQDHLYPKDYSAQLVLGSSKSIIKNNQKNRKKKKEEEEKMKRGSDGRKCAACGADGLTRKSFSTNQLLKGTSAVCKACVWGRACQQQQQQQQQKQKQPLMNTEAGATATDVAEMDLGQEERQDVSADAVGSLLGAMRLAAVPKSLSFGRKGRR